jgi:hypothetical protein
MKFPIWHIQKSMEEHLNDANYIVYKTVISQRIQ